jgi:hypothetical protein
MNGQHINTSVLLRWAAALLFVLGLAGCRDYCRGEGYSLLIAHGGDAAVQLEVRPSNGAVVRPDSLRPGQSYSFNEGPEGALQVRFFFAGGADTTLVLQVSGCGIWDYAVDSVEGLFT